MPTWTSTTVWTATWTASTTAWNLATAAAQEVPTKRRKVRLHISSPYIRHQSAFFFSTCHDCPLCTRWLHAPLRQLAPQSDGPQPARTSPLPSDGRVLVSSCGLFARDKRSCYSAPQVNHPSPSPLPSCHTAISLSRLTASTCIRLFFSQV